MGQWSQRVGAGESPGQRVLENSPDQGGWRFCSQVLRAAQILPLSLGLPPARASAMSWEDHSQRKEESEIQFFIAGVGAGFFPANIHLNEIGRAKLYCQPSSVRLPGQAYGQILQEYGRGLGDEAKGSAGRVPLAREGESAHAAKP